MKQLLDFVDIFIIAPFFLGYLWAADKFCKKFLGASKRREGLLWLAALYYFGSDVFRSVYFFCADTSCILYGIGDAAIPVRQGKKDSGCIRADGGCKAGNKFLRFFFIMSGTVFPAHGKKDSGTIWQRMDRRID